MASTWLAFKYEENNTPLSLQTPRSLMQPICPSDQVHLSNSASKPPRFIFTKKEKEKEKKRILLFFQYYQSLDFSVYF